MKTYKEIFNLDIDGSRKVNVIDNEWNLLDKDLQLICKQNFRWVYEIESDGLRIVLFFDGTKNLIDNKGNLIFKNNKKYITFCDIDNNCRIINDNEWNYKTYLKQKLIKELIK